MQLLTTCDSAQHCQIQPICCTSAMLRAHAYSMHITDVMFQSLIGAHAHLGTRLGAPPLQQQSCLHHQHQREQTRQACAFLLQEQLPELFACTESKLRQQGGVMQADSGPQICCWLAEARCRDVGINAECSTFNTRYEVTSVRPT